MNSKNNPLPKSTDFLFILLIALITFLPLITQLGYYRDDWHIAWGAMTQGPAAIIDQQKTDRPFMGVVYAAAYVVLGDAPLAWQVYALGARLAAALFFFLLVRTLWPRQRAATFMMAALFAVYPGFLQMPTASTHSNLLVAQAAGIFSLWMTALLPQVQKPLKRVLLTLLAMASSGVCFLIMEWMIGIEGVRLVLIVYLLLREGKRPFKTQAGQALLRWLPNLLVLGGFLVWRVFIFKSTRMVTDVGGLASTYLNDPVNMLLRLVLETAKSTLNAVLLAWFVPLYDLADSMSYGALLVGILLAVLSLAAAIGFLRSVEREPSAGSEPAQEDSWAKHAVWIGLLIAAITVVPVVAANRSLELRDTFDRYSLLAQMGAVMMAVGGGYALLSRRARVVLFGALLAGAVLTQYSNTSYFKRFWDEQRDLWWQLAWRAPDLKEGTTLVALMPSGYRFAESYEIWGPANMIYDPQSGGQSIKVSGEILNNETLINIENGDRFGQTFRRFEYMNDFTQALVVSLPAGGGCLHVYDGQNLELAENEDALVRQVAFRSHTAQILTDAPQAEVPTQVFGAEPAHGWCYYYQKASLARQQGDWEQAAALGTEARENGLGPSEASEWMPFYEAYARLGMMDEANEIGGKLRESPNFIKPYCAAHSTEGDENLSAINQFLITNLCPQE